MFIQNGEHLQPVNFDTNLLIGATFLAQFISLKPGYIKSYWLVFERCGLYYRHNSRVLSATSRPKVILPKSYQLVYRGLLSGSKTTKA
jgi:hypothetical protein